ncbi:MAG: universal stress protein [ANME-2 cluster archaeon]|nr:universal stress protein [ANME-2 cluster archaeon]
MTDQDLQKFSKIIIPLDGSKTAERGLKYAVSMANAFQAEIVVVSIVPKGKKAAGLFKTRLEEISPGLKERLKDMPASILMETYHHITLDTIKKHGLNVRSVLRPGEISKKSILTILMDLIKEERPDLIVLSSHKRSGLQKLTEGSITEELVRLSPIPVLVVKK